MFLQNKYSLWYNSIINKAKSQERSKKDGNYYEKHHIIPKSLGGNNDEINLVLLTYREHFICHWLLTKMVDDIILKRKMYNSFYIMSISNKKLKKRIFSSHLYEIARKYNVLSKLGIKYSDDRKETQSINTKNSWKNAKNRKKELSVRTKELFTGKPKSKTTKQKISQKLTGVKHDMDRNIRKSIRQKKNWKLVKNNNEIIITTDLQKYCNDNNYDTAAISNLKAHRIKYHKDLISAEIITGEV